jgi:hypothetical protein
LADFGIKQGGEIVDLLNRNISVMIFSEFTAGYNFNCHVLRHMAIE